MIDGKTYKPLSPRLDILSFRTSQLAMWYKLRARLTVFEDRSSPRPGREEVYFRTAADQSVVTRPDRVIWRLIWIPIDGVLLLLIAMAVVLWRWRGRSGFSLRRNGA
jgi:hypothetical protein